MVGKEGGPSGPRQREAECNLKPLEGAAPTAQPSGPRQSRRVSLAHGQPMKEKCIARPVDRRVRSFSPVGVHRVSFPTVDSFGSPCKWGRDAGHRRFSPRPAPPAHHGSIRRSSKPRRRFAAQPSARQWRKTMPQPAGCGLGGEGSGAQSVFRPPSQARQAFPALPDGPPCYPLRVAAHFAVQRRDISGRNPAVDPTPCPVPPRPPKPPN